MRLGGAGEAYFCETEEEEEGVIFNIGVSDVKDNSFLPVYSFCKTVEFRMSTLEPP